MQLWYLTTSYEIPYLSHPICPKTKKVKDSFDFFIVLGIYNFDTDIPTILLILYYLVSSHISCFPLLVVPMHTASMAAMSIHLLPLWPILTKYVLYEIVLHPIFQQEQCSSLTFFFGANQNYVDKMRWVGGPTNFHNYPRNVGTLTTLLRVLYLCHFGSTRFVLPIWPIVWYS